MKHWSAVEICPDAQSPEISAPCNPPPNNGGAAPIPSGPDIDQIPFTGTAWFDLLIGVAVALVLIGGLLLYYRWRKDRAQVNDG